MDIKCTKCQKPLMDPVNDRWESWTRLYNFLLFQNYNGEMSDAMYELLTNDVMMFKPIDDEEKEEE